LARFAYGRLDGLVSFLATTRKDGSPRLHPVTAMWATEAPFAERFTLFEFSVDEVASTEYEDHMPIRRKWKAD